MVIISTGRQQVGTYGTVQTHVSIAYLCAQQEGRAKVSIQTDRQQLGITTTFQAGAFCCGRIHSQPLQYMYKKRMSLGLTDSL